MARNRLRARELGIILGQLECGQFNAITDVGGVLVGHHTIVSGDGPLVPGKGPVRTGVTAILPHASNIFEDKVEGAIHVINGFGKTVGLSQVEELGAIETPIILTNTLSVGAALDGLISYMVLHNPEIGITTGTVNCLIGECNDGFLNDIQGRHVRPEHVQWAIDDAKSGVIAEGSVGAGTGMVCYGYKGGIGTSSRKLPLIDGGYTVGCLVLANFGKKEMLTIGGISIEEEKRHNINAKVHSGDGSVMVIIATDAPLDSRQLGRLARRASMGLARTGAVASHGSGDFVIAFSTTNRQSHGSSELLRETQIISEGGKVISLLFQAVVESVEEAVINALLMAETVVGRDGHIAEAISADVVLKCLGKRP
ncbi:MAG: P1 family peptidase [bacterium]|nr:P1 family peptidase [bacterium]